MSTMTPVTPPPQDAAAAQAVRTLTFVVPEGLDAPTGGNRYDQHVTRALTDAGTAVDLVPVPGTWPAPDDHARARLAAALRPDRVVLADGLIACGAPAQLAAAAAAGCRVYVLVHMPLALDPALSAPEAHQRDQDERAALAAATGVIATSAWAAAELRRRHGLTRVTIATPGAWPAPLATGSRPPHLLHLAAVTPLKNQLLTVSALAQLARLPWTASLTGSLDADPRYAAQVADAIAGRGLPGRVQLTGPVTGTALDQLWQRTDLLVPPSRAETWGMVVTEALAHGIPAIVAAGTGAVEALGETAAGALPGAVIDASCDRSLATAIGDLLGPAGAAARTAARERRAVLPGWDVTARILLDVLR